MPRLRIAIASDHGGFVLKQDLMGFLRDLGHQVTDLGPDVKEAVDYPDFAIRVAMAVAHDQADVGIMIDGAGIGSTMACNKVPGVLAANCYDLYSAANSREHNGANVLCLGGQTLGPGHARKITQTWLETPFGGDRHLRRVEKILGLDRDLVRKFS
jgi:ribose 5-phosphate isomerase B